MTPERPTARERPPMAEVKFTRKTRLTFDDATPTDKHEEER